MENKVNTATIVYSVICSIVGMVVTLFAYQLLYLNDKMEFIMEEKFKAKEYVTKDNLELEVSKAVFSEREVQAEAKTASLSWAIANEMGMERKDVAPIAAKVFRYGLEQMEAHEKRETQWQEFTKTRFLGVIQKPNDIGELTLYYRDITGDYLVRTKEVNGYVYSYWEDNNNIKHPLRERDEIKTVLLQ